uniref:2-C-methyl-D-erythritol 4-phosphate cytidylyltransferaseic isoform X1 n=1 Tax=Rhizophora mucronata TaxID=61149 RepID=A0A2P2KR68_RHIMU
MLISSHEMFNFRLVFFDAMTQRWWIQTIFILTIFRTHFPLWKRK